MPKNHNNNFNEFITAIHFYRKNMMPELHNFEEMEKFNNVLSNTIQYFIKQMEYQGKPEEIEKILRWLEDENL